MRRIDVAERRARLGSRHRLAPSARAADPADVADALVALHGTDPASVFLAAGERMRTAEVGAIERALYEDRTLVRMLGMRRTMFVVPRDLAPVVHASCTRAIAAVERRRLVQHLGAAEIADDVEGWLAELSESTLRALVARGSATAAELAVDEPRLRTSMLMAAGKAYEARQYVSTRVLFLLAADGHIVRGRPRGSWTSSQYQWWPWQRWLPGEALEWSTADAQAELARRWLAAFGPATVADLRWWTGWTAGDARKALAAVGPVEVDLDGSPGIVLADDVDAPPPVEPWVALLPALDPTPMGWKGRDWFLGEHAAALFDRSGNIGPSIWCDGRIVGGWAQRGDGEVVARLLEDIGAEASARVHGAADRLTRWLGPIRSTPRFRTPLERELTA